MSSTAKSVMCFIVAFGLTIAALMGFAGLFLNVYPSCSRYCMVLVWMEKAFGRQTLWLFHIFFWGALAWMFLRIGLDFRNQDKSQDVEMTSSPKAKR